MILTKFDPFSLRNSEAYAVWRADKLDNYPTRIEPLTTPIANPRRLSPQEHLSLRRACAKANFALYESKRPMDKSDVIALGHQLGLTQLCHNLYADSDGISTLRVESGKDQGEYIPYTNQMLNWHTDGYYNSGDNAIGAFILHCASSADSGGETSLLDHEIVYLLLRDQNPDFIAALMHPQAMSIPENRIGGTLFRNESVGPVISISNAGDLHFRYTARTRSIAWGQESLLIQARKALTHIFDNQGFVFKHSLQKHQGLICNNLLHSRAAFSDSDSHFRTVYRARYYDRVKSTK